MTGPVGHVAASDCERCRPGLVAQPANTVSSLTLVVSGALVLRALRRHRVSAPTETAVGWAAVAAGLGSVAYHGPGTAFGRYLHDATLLALLGAVTLADVERVTGRPAPPALAAAVPALSMVAAHPSSSMGAQLVLGVGATAGEAARFASVPAQGSARWRRRIEGAVAGAGALAHVFGRTGGPWCHPDGLTQPHAAWHGAMATAIWLRSLDLR